MNQTANFSVIDEQFERLKSAAPLMARTTAKERIALLKNMLTAVESRRTDITDALYADYNRHPVETEIADTWVVIKEIKFAIKHLKSWMADKHVPTPLAFFGASSRIKYEAKGVVLVIAPWNFPFNLSLSPLVSAIAAGNTVLVKPSEFTPNSGKVIKEIIEETFDKTQVDVVLGGLEESKALLKLPFNHIFFTGSPAVGKLVMKAAAEHLTSVTLELGGKTPAIVDKTANLKKTAKIIASSKFFNNGQICIATDYVYVHSEIKEQFYEELKITLSTFYPQKKWADNPDYARLVDQKHTDRILNLLSDAQDKGAKMLAEPEIDSAGRLVSPIVLSNVTDEMTVNQEEIFGPILPIKTFETKEEVVSSIATEEKPLALYVFSKSKSFQDYILHHTSSGAAVINEASVHHFNSHLPFGGVNNSGMGKSHGHFGFLEFTNQKAVVKQWLPLHISALLQPPYTKFSKGLVNVLIKFFK